MNKIYAFIDNTSDSEKILKEGVNSFSFIKLSKNSPRAKWHIYKSLLLCYAVVNASITRP